MIWWNLTLVFIEILLLCYGEYRILRETLILHAVAGIGFLIGYFCARK